MRRHLLAVVLAALTPTVPLAQGTGAPVHKFGWVVDATFEVGGETVAEVTFTDGDTQKITAGQGGTFSVGVEYRPVPRLGLRGLVGWKFATSAADNVNLMFTRFPIEGVASWSLNKDWRLGAGLTHHTGITFDFDGVAPNVDFDPTTGATLELGWRWLALTYTAMQYRAEDGTQFDAGAFGVSLSYVFGKK